MVEIIISKPATEQLKEIHSYIKKSSPQNADHVVEAFIKKINSLASHPEVGRPVAISRRGIVRQSKVFKYRMFYCFYQNRIEVIAVYHSSMDIDLDKNVITPFNLSDD